MGKAMCLLRHPGLGLSLSHHCQPHKSSSGRSPGTTGISCCQVDPEPHPCRQLPSSPPTSPPAGPPRTTVASVRGSTGRQAHTWLLRSPRCCPDCPVLSCPRANDHWVCGAYLLSVPSPGLYLTWAPVVWPEDSTAPSCPLTGTGQPPNNARLLSSQSRPPAPPLPAHFSSESHRLHGSPLLLPFASRRQPGSVPPLDFRQWSPLPGRGPQSEEINSWFWR